MNINTFTESFENTTDFRQPWKIKHNLIEIIFIAVVATVANANTWIEGEAFAESKEDWLKKYISLENGIRKWNSISRYF